MKKGRIAVSVVVALLALGQAWGSEPGSTSSGQLDKRMLAEAGRIVSKYKAVFVAPPKHVPSFKSVDGPITGNGDVGLTVSGTSERQTYWISKNDFWKSGPDFKQCGPSLIGGIDVHIDAMKNASYRVEQVLYEPVISAGFATKDGSVNIDARVLATANIIVLEFKAARAPVRIQLKLWAKDGYGSTTESVQEGEVISVARKFNASNLLFPTEATIAMHSRGFTGNSFVLEPGKTVVVVVAVATNHETKEHSLQARDKAGRLSLADISKLKGEHDAWWRAFWAESFVEIEDKVIEKFYYSSLYIMACCSRNKNFPPGLYGNWITMDRTAWSGDIHLNYNHQAPFWALYSSNRVKLTDPYDAPLLEHLDEFRAHAKKYLNKKGAYASVGIGPKGLTCRFFDKAGMDAAYKKKCEPGSYDDLIGEPMFLGQKSNAIFAGMNMILRYHYTYDRDYAAKVYPYLSAVAEFWEDYLTLENGRYVIHDDNYGEVGPWEGGKWREGYGDFNPIISLGFLRVLLPAMIEISEDLNLDQDKRARWAHILANLSAFPVHNEGGRKRFRACEGGHGSGSGLIGLDWVMIHALVYPACNIGLSSGPVELAMIRNDIKGFRDDTWLEHGGAFQTVLIGAARVGYDPVFLLAKAKEKIEKCSYPNLWIPAEGGGIETCSGIPGMVNEMMLQSHGGIMRIFPVFPANQKATFYRLRTFGAFLVSSAIENGNILYVRIESEKGRDCTVQNPWPGKAVDGYRDGKKVFTLKGERVVMKTESGVMVVLVPEGMTCPIVE